MTTDFIKQLLEAGVHFGHQTKRWNPKMAKYIFDQRNGVYIIDLEKTAACLEEARAFLKDLAAKGESILFVGTKKQAREIIRQEAERAGVFYVSERWVGGLLTNFQTVRKSVKRLKELERMQQDGIMNKLSKKEVARLTKEMDKLKNNFSGILDMEALPRAIFIIDPKKEDTAIKEADRLDIPVVALIDTNGDPDMVDFCIPGNDDAIRSIKLVVTLVADAVSEGRKEFLHMKKEISKPVVSKAEEPITPIEEKVIEEKVIEKLVDEEVIKKIEEVDITTTTKVFKKKPHKGKEEEI